MARIIGALVIAAAAAGFAFTAGAADLPRKAPALAPVPTLYNWGGWYAGANAGYSWARTSADYLQDAGFIFGVPPFDTGGGLSTSLNPGSFIGGGQLGFNYQAGMWVFGVETDIAWRERTESATFLLNPVVPGVGGGDTLTLSDKQKWVGTARARLGLAPPTMSNWLFYVTGGVAYGGFDHSVTQFCNVECGQTRILSDSVTRAGWTVGGGVEVGLSRNWTVAAEYLYMDFGTETLSDPTGGVFAATAGGVTVATTTTFPATSVSFHDKSQVARLKLNYRFDGAGLH